MNVLHFYEYDYDFMWNMGLIHLTIQITSKGAYFFTIDNYWIF